MAGLTSALGSILRYASNVSSDGLAKGTLKTLEDKKMQLIRADGSMMKLLGKYIVEPVVVVSEDLKDTEDLDNILGLHMDLFTGYYMQTFDILRDQYGLGITTVVDTLATDNGGLMRVVTAGLDAGISMSNEDADYLGDLIKLADCSLSTEAPSPEYIKTYDSNYAKKQAESDFSSAHAANETAKENALTEVKENAKLRAKRADESIRRAKLSKSKASDRVHLTNKDIVRIPTTLAETHKDLLIPNAIERTIQITAEVSLQEPGTDGVFHTKTIIIPVTIKLAVMFVSKDSIMNAIETESDEYSFSSRLDDYRSGAISLADFVLASDLIQKYKKHKLKDKEGLMAINKARELSSNSKMVTNGFAGFEKYYNMFIVSPEVKTSIEREVRAKLISPKGKDRFLERGHGLSVTIIDQDYERIQIMVKDIRGKTDLSFKSAIKKDKGGSDYSEIIKALMANKPPAF